MRIFLLIVLALALVGVLAALVLGVGSLAAGGETSKRWSNKLMRARVALQFAAVVVLALLVLVGSGGD